MPRIPLSLDRPPLVLSVFEIRFEAKEEGRADLLPGLLYARIADAFPTGERTATGNVPRQLLSQHPELKYVPQFKLAGPGDKEVLLIGQNVLALHISAPYPGWAAFKAKCLRVAAALHAADHVALINRYSLKYSNFIEHNSENPLEGLRIKIDLGAHDLRGGGFLLRFEIKDASFVSIVECSAGSKKKEGDPPVAGTVLSIDTIRQENAGEFWTASESHLDAIHATLETIFFDLLSGETTEALGPTWETQQ